VRRAAAVTLLAACSLAIPARALAKDPPFPKFTAPVVDAAGLVPDEVEQRVNAALLDYQQRTNNQVAVAVIKTTGNKSLEDYTIDLARKWGVGQEGKDNGVLLLIANQDHKVRIEVGRGLEGELTDLQSGRIIRERLLPNLRRGDVGAAVAQGTDAIRSVLRDPLVGQLPPPPVEPESPQPDDGGGAWFAIVGALAFGALSFAGRRRGRRRGWGWMPVYWPGGGFGGGGGGGGGGGFGGGGFGGGGGGGFGGGGASGGW
jgi:uncharacterized protein